LEPERFEAVDEFLGDTIWVDPVEVIVTEFLIGSIGLEHLIGEKENFVSHCHNCFRPTSSGFNTVEEGPQVTVFGVGTGPGGLRQDAT
jgi:hypothetical protein